MSVKGWDFPLPVEWQSACNCKVQPSFAAEIFQAGATDLDEATETAERYLADLAGKAV